MINVISNGLGSQSMRLLQLAAEGVLHSRLAICGDTGSENDRLRSDGVRQSAREYFDEIVKPYSEANNIEAVFVRSIKKDGSEYESLIDQTRAAIKTGNMGAILIPLYGSEGGQRKQRCTDRYKLKAIRRYVRKVKGFKEVRFLQGIVIEEAQRRVKGVQVESIDDFRTFRVIERYELKSVDGAAVKVPRFLQWCFSAYPLADLRLTRSDCQESLRKAGIPYLESSECDMCPYQDWPRWSRHAPEVIDEIADLESKMGGEYFFTNLRIPLKRALPILQKRHEEGERQLSFGCLVGGFCNT